MTETLADEQSSASQTATPTSPVEVELNSSLKDLQSDEHRKILDVVAQLRKCGLDSVLSLPQIVVCGDQSSGKSSTLEAITEIPFEYGDKLCTRFATEIHLKNALSTSVTVRVIPGPKRPEKEQVEIKAFERTITDLKDFRSIMKLAAVVMGITRVDNAADQPPAIARDTLSIRFECPGSPELSLVDIPGLIATETMGVTSADISMVAEITDHYISQPRTICLAVVTAANDHANQVILRKVREVDPEGNRTLGVITKPDRLAAGSGSEKAFIDLARNKDIFFKLGWHVLKNRTFEEHKCSLEERHFSENTFFSKSNFKDLPKENVGIGALKQRLSQLLFEHVKKELPKLKADLETALTDARQPLALLGIRRSTAEECKHYLARLGMEYHKVALAAVNGHYEGEYFHKKIDPTFSLGSPATICRIRAVVQFLNTEFNTLMVTKGQKYCINMSGDAKVAELHTKIKKGKEDSNEDHGSITSLAKPKEITKEEEPKEVTKEEEPKEVTKEEAIEWVRKVLIRNRGKELVGNFNPLIIGELFWEQSSRWGDVAKSHVEQIGQICTSFLKNLLNDTCPSDVANRVWSSLIEDKLKERTEAASKELALLLKELRGHPINYNHYYKDTIEKNRLDRQNAALTKSIAEATTQTCFLDANLAKQRINSVDVNKAIAGFSSRNNPNMDVYSCEEALDCLESIYKVLQKQFVANVTIQVIERHIVGDLEEIFNPVVVSDLSETAVQNMASEPVATKRQRAFLEDRIRKLKVGQAIFKSVM